MKGLREHNNIQQSETQLTHSDPVRAVRANADTNSFARISASMKVGKPAYCQR